MVPDLKEQSGDRPSEVPCHVSCSLICVGGVAMCEVQRDMEERVVAESGT